VSKNLRVLMVEDSDSDATLILRELTRHGYSPVCERVETARGMQAALDKKTWDIVVSDYVLPGFSGLGALKLLQEKNLDIPCIITSGRIDDETAVAAMRAGAKDYIMKDNLKRLGPAVERELAEAEVRRERRKTEEALQQNEAKLHLMLEEMPCILWTADQNLKVTSIMGAGLKSFDFKPAQMLGQTMSEVLGEDSQDSETMSAHRRALDNFPASFEIDPGGRTLYCFVEPLHDIDGAVTGVIGVALDVTDKKHAEDELRALSNKLVDTQETERRTIARELHDQIGQSLTVLKLMIGQAARSPGDKAAAVLNESQTVVTELIQQVREMSLRLRPSMLDDLGLLPTLLWHFEKFTNQTHIRIQFEHSGLERQLPPEVNTAVYRIIQEALTNIARYAKVDEARVEISVSEDLLVLEIADRGSGFDPEKLVANASTGLSGMRERAHLLGGRLTIDTKPGQGTWLTAELPLSHSIKK
jgi:two-component system, NarL family, sensor histidine kinase UhpB